MIPTDPMSCEDRQQLLDLGFSAAMIEELDRRHFKPCRLPKDSLPPSKVPHHGFLRQTTLPHLHIALTPYDTPESLDTALYDAGRRDGHDLLGGFFMRFFDAVKNRPSIVDLADVVQRLTALEARLNPEPSTTNDHAPPSPPPRPNP